VADFAANAAFPEATLVFLRIHAVKAGVHAILSGFFEHFKRRTVAYSRLHV
jgi:hypothetical protein